MSATAPLGPRRLDFSQLSDDDFELLVYLVVLLEHPDAIRLRAPDKGADSALPTTGGSYARGWQAKRFTSSVSWPQCRGSLDSAVEAYAMPHYTFCFARDLTGKQQGLFDKHLVGRHEGVHVDWWGASKLTAFLLGSEQGKRIEAHFYGDPELDTKALLRALKSGGELSTGADAVGRMNEIADFFESSDPFFSYAVSSRSPSVVPHVPMTPGAAMAVEITTGEDRAIRIEALPRNRAALERMPTSQLQFPTTPEGVVEYDKFRATLLAGGEATFSTVGIRIDNLPAGLEAFAPEDVPMELRVRAEKQPPRPWDATVRVQSDRGEAHLDIDLRPVDPPEDWDGALAGTVDGLTMTLLLRMRGGRGQSHARWSYRVTGGAVRAQANLLELLDAAHGAGVVSIEERDRRPESAGERRLVFEVAGQEPDPRIVVARRLLEDLRVIEDWIGEPFDLPDDWTTANYEDVPSIAEMIRTGQRRGSPAATLVVPPDKLQEMAVPPFAVWMSHGIGISLFGVEYPLGFLSGGFDGRIVRADPVVEDGEKKIHLEIGTFNPNADVVFKFTREGPPSGD